MRTFLIAAVLVLFAAPALACRGTTEYPQTAERLKGTEMPADEKSEMTERLNKGWQLHSQGHQTGDMDAVSRSLRILDGVKDQLGQK